MVQPPSKSREAGSTMLFLCGPCYPCFTVRYGALTVRTRGPCAHRCALVHPVRPCAPPVHPVPPCAPLCTAVRSVRLSVRARTITRFRTRGSGATPLRMSLTVCSRAAPRTPTCTHCHDVGGEITLCCMSPSIGYIYRSCLKFVLHHPPALGASSVCSK